MNVSVAWLEAMLGRTLDPKETAERLTLLGAAVDAIEPLYEGLDDVVVAEVEEVGKHPNADRLSLCKVNAGGELLEVICGAPNVTAGKRYPFAPVGATLPGGFTLERRKIRGIASNGMLCSAKELGLGTDHSGILELHTDAALGTPLVEALGLKDTRLVVDVTPNRPDLLGHRGVARDLAAATGGSLRLASIPGLAAKSKAARRVERTGTVDGVTVTIDDAEGCPRYVAAVIRGVRVGPSPAWLQARLRGVGLRPINNVVDATNYILYEYGQPLHAFDLTRLRGGAVIVRRARKSERLTTLDGVARALDPEMTMICDGEGPIAVAGVMGGGNSEVGPETTDLLLECAAFDPKRIRRTRTQLKMSTDASYRFERGVDVQDLAAVARRAVDVIIAVAGGAEREAALDVFPVPVQPRTVFLRPARVEHLLGVPVTVKEIEGILTRLGFTVAPREERVAVQVPGWRPDVTREVDLIEEIARVRGFDSFPVEVRPYRPTTVPEDPRERAKARLRTLLTGFGLNEARSIPFDAGGEGAQAIKNPLSQEEGYLRRELLPGLVRAVERNWAAHERNVRLFEIGNVFRARGEDIVPEERLRLAAVLTGLRAPWDWTNPPGPPDPAKWDFDLWDVRAMLEACAGLAGPMDAAIAPDGDGWVLRDAAGAVRGHARALTAEAPPWAGALVGFELDLDATPRPTHRFEPLPAHPAVTRDLALLLPPGVTAGSVEDEIRAAAGNLLEDLGVFDEYRGKELGERRSVAWSLSFRASDRTLRDEEVDTVIARVLKRLEERLDVHQRR